MRSEYCVGIPELFSLNWSKDPCLSDGIMSCKNPNLASKACPIGVDFFRFPSGELRLDFAHCNLNCLPCWAKHCPHEGHFNCYEGGYGAKEHFSAEEIVNRLECRARKLNKYVEANKTFQIRITGGEPFLSNSRWAHLVEVLNILDRRLDPENKDYSKPLDNRLHDYGRRNQRKRKRLVVQTNGISLERTVSLRDISNTARSLRRVSLLVHHSIKGARPDEFHLLTRANENLFKHQVELITKLTDAGKATENFDFQIVLGFFHSAEYILWNPKEKKPMLTEPDPLFRKEVKRNWERTYAEPLDFRSRMIKKANTVERCFRKGVVRERSEVPGHLRFQLRPLAPSGKKVRINQTFWHRLI